MGDEYNWDDFDSQAAEYLGSSDYQGDAFTTDDGMSWGGQGDPNSQYNFNQAQQPQDYTSDMFGSGSLGNMFSMNSNFSIPQGTFNFPQSDQQFGFGGQGVGVQPGQFDIEQSMPQVETGSGTDYFSKGMSGLSQLLSGVFNQKQGQSSTAKQLASVVAALMEGKQNKQMASQIPQAVQDQQQRTSPFDVASSGASSMGANSMRDAMQQKLAAAMTDPYGQPIVKSQVDALAREQAIRDAKAGRRSNNATSSPAMMAEQAKVAQNYINSLQQPAGAGINPSSQGLEQIVQALKYGTQGTTSPMLSALGYGTGANQNSNQMQQIQDMINKAVAQRNQQ